MTYLLESRLYVLFIHVHLDMCPKNAFSSINNDSTTLSWYFSFHVSQYRTPIDLAFCWSAEDVQYRRKNKGMLLSPSRSVRGTIESNKSLGANAHGSAEGPLEVCKSIFTLFPNYDLLISHISWLGFNILRPTFRRRHIQMHFLERKHKNLDWYFTEFCSYGSN